MTEYIMMGLILSLCFIFGLRWPLALLFLATNSYVLRNAIPSSAMGLPPGLLEDLLSLGLPVVVLGTTVIRGLTTHRAGVLVPSTLDLLVAGGMPLLLLGATYSPDVDRGINITLRYLALCVGYYAAVRALGVQLGPKRLVNQFAGASFLGAAVIAALSLFMPILTSGQRLTVGDAHPIPFSLMLAVGILGGLFILLTSTRLANRLVAVLGLGLISAQFLSTITRGTFLSLIVAIIASTALLTISSRVRYRGKLIAPALGATALILAWGFWIRPDASSQLIEGILRLTSDSIGTSAEQRIAAYHKALEAGLSSPLLGIGTGGFKTIGSLDYPHNLFLELFSENGLIGLSWILLLTLSAAILAMRGTRTHLSPESLSSLLFATGMYVLHFIEAQVSFTLWMHKGLFVSLALSVVCSQGQPDATRVGASTGIQEPGRLPGKSQGTPQIKQIEVSDHCTLLVHGED